jgi:hypothetical protein
MVSTSKSKSRSPMHRIKYNQSHMIDSKSPNFVDYTYKGLLPSPVYKKKKG